MSTSREAYFAAQRCFACRNSEEHRLPSEGWSDRQIDSFARLIDNEFEKVREDRIRLDWLEDFFARYPERSVLRRNFASDLRQVGFRAAIDMARNAKPTPTK